MMAPIYTATPELVEARDDVFPGHRRLWKYFRDSDSSLVVYLTMPMSTSIEFAYLHEKSQLIAVQWPEGRWLKWSLPTRSWQDCPAGDGDLFSSLPRIGSIPH